MAKLVETIESMGIIFTAVFFFFLIFTLICWFFFHLEVKPQATPQNSLKGQFSPLACLWEDAPPTALKGQSYHLATPLMTPFACILSSGWQHFYRENLGKPGIDYWEWANFPESDNVCPELSALLSLPFPGALVKSILMQLSSYSPSTFSQGDFWQQTEKRLWWQHWHLVSEKICGRDSLQRIYRVCFGLSWATVTEIMACAQNQEIYWWQVLQVEPETPAPMVEKAYKGLMRYWHPDINSHPYANQISTMINVAYQQYTALPSTPSPRFTWLGKLVNLFSSFPLLKTWRFKRLSR